MDNKKSSLLKYFDDEQMSQLKKMIVEFGKDEKYELEASFMNVGYSNYVRILNHYINWTDEKKIRELTSFDISIQLENSIVFRVSFLGEEAEKTLDKYQKSYKSNILEDILNVEPGKNVLIVYKDRGSAIRLLLEDLGVIIRLTSEIPYKKGDQKPKIGDRNKILFRYKERVSFEIDRNIRLDVSQVNQSSSIQKLFSSYPRYEIEMEVINSKISVEFFLSEMEKILLIVQKSIVPIGKNEAKQVLQEYRKLLGLDNMTHLETRNVISIEPQHIVRFIPNKYAVTDKADGERYFLFIVRGNVYLISVNLDVVKTDLSVTDGVYEYTLLDGEYIRNENGSMFLAFDVIYHNKTDYRYDTKVNLPQRLRVLNDIVNGAFGNLIPFAYYIDKFTDLELGQMRKYYGEELKRYWKVFRQSLQKSKTLFVSRKIYFVPYGIAPGEVFMYADLVWKLLVYEKLPPYKLDGIIYTPIESPYMIKADFKDLDHVPMEYKWKPPTQNSIDFYIKYELDEIGREAIFYDNKVVRGEGNEYKICGLYVGVSSGGGEKPVPFRIEGEEQKARIYLVDGEARDVEGNIIEDGMVVEFVYDNTKSDIKKSHRWVPLRIRYDKTESVRRYRRRYGNNLYIAMRIWRSIVNPITEENIAVLANPETYQREIEHLSKNINDAYPSNTYYQKISNVGDGVRAFNNWVKLNMIMTYGKNKEKVLDVGCGRGGDIIKFYWAKIGEYVGIDIDNNGLYIINDSAFNRYKHLTKVFSNFPPMYFINADMKGPLDVESQEKILPYMTNVNKKLIVTHLSGNKKYDVINVQFNIHYYLSDEISWNNFCQNISNHIADNGYMLVTTFDGNLVYEKLVGKQKLSITYTDSKGRRNIFFEMIKVYDDRERKDLGMAIDLYNSLISNPGTYIREYLVFPEFLQKSLKEKCGLDLVESDYFVTLFHMYKKIFTNDHMDISSDSGLNKLYRKIKSFYYSLDSSTKNFTGDTLFPKDIALASFDLLMFNRYYVFRKTKNVNLTEPARIIGINHKINLGKFLMPYFETNCMFISPEYRTFQINDIYHKIRKKYPNIQPSVYLIRHNIMEETVDNEIFRRNKLDFFLIKKGKDKILLIYKSPEKYFYPIAYQGKNGNTFLLESDKIVEDLNILVTLSKKINRK
ncbi:MAG: methyltransferase domain-containing protein [Thermoplasmata archaeon]